MMPSSTWSLLQIGRHAGRTLPQVVFGDPDWFFWAHAERIFRGPQSHEADRLYRRATAIRIPDDDGTLVVEYLVDRSSGRFAGMQLVPRFTDAADLRTGRVAQIDLSVPRRMRVFDKTGSKIMIRDFKDIVLGDATVRLTRRRAESFFEDDSNFVLSDGGVVR